MKYLSSKFTLVILFVLFISFRSLADEGMWLPQFLQELNESEMKAKGMKISAADLYNINKSSLKDAVVQFGGGCTGEVVSAEGLLFTNHHCGFGQIQSLSTVEKDYVTNGYWAKNKSEELPCPGLTVTFIVRIDDVTSKVLEGIKDDTGEAERKKIIADNSKKLEEEATKDTHYKAFVRSFFYDNEYYLYVTEVFKDVRLVGAPPSSIGKFGGDTDNWMWPRHTGDFSVFRIYAGADNKPADYSKDNQPFVPRNFLKISMKGVKEGDFTITYGFPGKTYKYLTSYGIKVVTEISNPNSIKIREKRLAIWASDMKESDKVRLQYVSKYAGISNYYKKYAGELKGMRLMNTIEVKEKQEAEFQAWADQNKFSNYQQLLPDFKKAYEQLYPLQLENDLMNEAGNAIELVKYAGSFYNLYKISKDEKTKEEDIKKEVETLKKALPNFYKNYNPSTDEKIMAALLKYYSETSKAPYRADIFEVVKNKYKNDYSVYAKEVFEKSMFDNQAVVENFLNTYSRKSSKKLEKDAGFILMRSLVDNHKNKIAGEYADLQSKINLYYRTWIQGLREMNKDGKFWPDANSTLRVAYGTVESLKPFDGARYEYASTLTGVIEKMDNGNDEFKVPAKLYDLYQRKDFGDYAVNGDVPVGFIATNHTTGGNSGSPLLDAEGRLIGINFDTNWEGTMSNYHFAPSRVRNISVDVRYVLFIIDKFADAGYLLDEMQIEK